MTQFAARRDRWSDLGWEPTLTAVADAPKGAVIIREERQRHRRGRRAQTVAPARRHVALPVPRRSSAREIIAANRVRGVDGQSSPPVAQLLDLSSRHVLVTGASRGIGAGIAVRLAEAGAAVTVHASRRTAELEEVASSCERLAGRAHVVTADLKRPRAGDVVVAGATTAGGALHGVVNNAGLQPLSPLDSVDESEIDDVFGVNLRAVAVITRAAAASAKAAGHPLSVVNISSIEGEAPAILHSHYASSKAALNMFTRAAALEFGPDGVRVNAVLPGLIHRESLETDWPDGVARYLAAVPLRRLGTPGDVADACLFLLSDASRWITGALLRVDGGVTANQPY